MDKINNKIKIHKILKILLQNLKMTYMQQL